MEGSATLARPSKRAATQGKVGLLAVQAKNAPSKNLPFKDALLYARSLKLASSTLWRGWCKSGARPANIPAAPDQVYKHDCWEGWGHWLGTGNTSSDNAAEDAKVCDAAEDAKVCADPKQVRVIASAYPFLFAAAGLVVGGFVLGLARNMPTRIQPSGPNTAAHGTRHHVIK